MRSFRYLALAIALAAPLAAKAALLSALRGGVPPAGGGSNETISGASVWGNFMSAGTINRQTQTIVIGPQVIQP